MICPTAERLQAERLQAAERLQVAVVAVVTEGGLLQDLLQQDPSLLQGACKKLVAHERIRSITNDDASRDCPATET